MTAVHESLPEGKTRADWLSQFSEACLRITSKLDLDGVLQEVVDSACTLTEARYGALIIFDDSGGMNGLRTFGITSEEIQQLGDLPKGLGILGYMNEIDGPLRLTDIASHPRAVGFPENHPPMKTFLGCPIRHQGERLGNIYLTEKVGGREFSPEDEKSLMLFASQAALVIANARKHWEETQARLDLEALVNISPVGVLVFDAKTGRLLSVNEETRRIVGTLNASGTPLSQLLEKMTLKTPEGREIPLDELPITRALKSKETVRADEVVIHLRDGRSIPTLVNARPIHGENGDVVSVVATIQDITRLEEIKKERNEFLGRVNHELRTPLTAIKGSTATMLGSPRSLEAAEARQLLRIIDEQADHMRHLLNNLLDMTQIESGTLSVTLEPMNLEEIAQQAKDAFLREEGTNQIGLDFEPRLPRVMADQHRIFQVLSILFEIASEHSHESSTIRVRASLRDPYVEVYLDSVDGSLSEDSLPPFWRAEDEYARARGDSAGVSLAICRGIVEAHGGRMSAEITLRNGARFAFTIPAFDEVEHSVEKGASTPGVRQRKSERKKGRILVVDNDPETRRYVRTTLAEAGFTPVLADNLEEMELLMGVEEHHLVIGEPMLAWGEGVELMERIREISNVPVIFVSSYGGGQTMNRAFELGAADYVVKPFTPTELVARTNAALRRHLASAPDGRSKPFVMGDLNIDYEQHLVTVAGRRVQLTATEYRLIVELSRAAGRVLTYEQLLRRTWGPLYSTDLRIVHTYIKQLRSKLGDDARQPAYIFTEPRVGYYMAGSQPRPRKE